MCEKQFKASDYSCNDLEIPSHIAVKRKRLRADAVPSAFDFPEHKMSTRKQPAERFTIIPTPKLSPKVSKKIYKPTIDHSYSASLTKKIAKLTPLVSRKNKQIKRLQAKNIRKAKTVHTLIKKLNTYKYISQVNAHAFVQNFNEVAVDLFKNQAKNENRGTGSRYEKSMKEFAVTLHFYSPRGYRFVGEALCLPSPSTSATGQQMLKQNQDF